MCFLNWLCLVVCVSAHLNVSVCLQSSPSSPPEPASLPAEDVSVSSNGPKPAEIILDDDPEDLFAGMRGA